jgi:hypothetical protein
VPSQDRFGLNDAGQTNQAWPQTSHQYQQRSVTRTEPRMMRSTPQGNIELVPEKQVLNFNSAPRAERINDYHHKQMTECEHRLEW